MDTKANRDEDDKKGAVEQDRPGQKTNVAPLSEQLDHQYQDPLNKMSDSDYPEPGQNEEHSGEPQGRNQLDRDTRAKTKLQRDPDGNSPDGSVETQDPTIPKDDDRVA